METRSLAIACAVASCVACSGGASQTSGPTGPQSVPANAPAAERVVVLLENLAGSLDAANNDCGEVATQLSGWVERHGKGEYADLARDAKSEDLDPDLRDRYDLRLRKALGAILDVVGGCGEHTDAQTAFVKFDVLLDPR